MNYHDFVNKFMHELCIHLCIIYLMNHKELTQVQRFLFFFSFMTSWIDKTLIKTQL